MLAYLIWGALLGPVANQQPTFGQLSPYPATLRLDSPRTGQVTAQYDCFGVPIALEFEQARDGVRILSYTGSAGPSSPENLHRWNTWLGELDTFTHYSFACQTGGYEGLGFHGFKDGEPYRVGVLWREGQPVRQPMALEERHEAPRPR